VGLLIFVKTSAGRNNFTEGKSWRKFVDVSCTPFESNYYVFIVFSERTLEDFSNLRIDNYTGVAIRRCMFETEFVVNSHNDVKRAFIEEDSSY
jgi:hypothetical protein